MGLIDREYMHPESNRRNPNHSNNPQYRHKHWNWTRTFIGLFQISLLVFVFSIVFQNLSFLNSIHPYIPAGLLMAIILGIAIINHVYKVVKWYLAYAKHSYNNHKRIGKIIIHLCLYLIVIAIALSIPINFNSVQNIEKHNSEDLYNYSKDKNNLLIETNITNHEINNKWVYDFMLTVNSARKNTGLQEMTISTYLNDIAKIRFNIMQVQPFISHYGVHTIDTGEVIFYPNGFTPKNYADDIRKTAYLHWNLLMYPSFTEYGFYIETGPVVGTYGLCSITEIPAPGIDVKKYLRDNGCSITVTNDTWLVIEMS